MHGVGPCFFDIPGTETSEFLESQLRGDANILHEFDIRFLVALVVGLLVDRSACDLGHVLDDVREWFRRELYTQGFGMRPRYQAVQESFAPVSESVRPLRGGALIPRQERHEIRLPFGQAAPRYVEQRLQCSLAFAAHRTVVPGTGGELLEPRGQSRRAANRDATAQEPVRL